MLSESCMTQWCRSRGSGQSYRLTRPCKEQPEPSGDSLRPHWAQDPHQAFWRNTLSLLLQLQTPLAESQLTATLSQLISPRASTYHYKICKHFWKVFRNWKCIHLWNSHNHVWLTQRASRHRCLSFWGPLYQWHQPSKLREGSWSVAALGKATAKLSEGVLPLKASTTDNWVPTAGYSIPHILTEFST